MSDVTSATVGRLHMPKLKKLVKHEQSMKA
jgi:hypothetical protein